MGGDAPERCEFCEKQAGHSLSAEEPKPKKPSRLLALRAEMDERAELQKKLAASYGGNRKARRRAKSELKHKKQSDLQEFARSLSSAKEKRR